MTLAAYMSLWTEEDLYLCILGMIPAACISGARHRTYTAICCTAYVGCWQILLQKSGKKKEACLSVGP
jgi:hypothetical protein